MSSNPTQSLDAILAGLRTTDAKVRLLKDLYAKDDVPFSKAELADTLFDLEPYLDRTVLNSELKATKANNPTRYYHLSEMLIDENLKIDRPWGLSEIEQLSDPVLVNYALTAILNNLHSNVRALEAGETLAKKKQSEQLRIVRFKLLATRIAQHQAPEIIAATAESLGLFDETVDHYLQAKPAHFGRALRINLERELGRDLEIAEKVYATYSARLNIKDSNFPHLHKKWSVDSWQPHHHDVEAYFVSAKLLKKSDQARKVMRRQARGIFSGSEMSYFPLHASDIPNASLGLVKVLLELELKDEAATFAENCKGYLGMIEKARIYLLLDNHQELFYALGPITKRANGDWSGPIQNCWNEVLNLTPNDPLLPCAAELLIREGSYDQARKLVEKFSDQPWTNSYQPVLSLIPPTTDLVAAKKGC